MSSDMAGHRDVDPGASLGNTRENLSWFLAHAPDVHDSALRDDHHALATLAARLPHLTGERQLVLADRERELVLARLDVPGSIVDALAGMRDAEVSLAEMFHTVANVPGTDRPLEIQRYELGPAAGPGQDPPPASIVPPDLVAAITAATARPASPGSPEEVEAALRLLWTNHERFVRAAPVPRVARLVDLLRAAEEHAGLFIDVECSPDRMLHVFFAVASPPHPGLLAQVMQVFDRLEVGVRRSLALCGRGPGRAYFLGSFCVAPRSVGPEGLPALLMRLRSELYNTQVLAAGSPTYRALVATHLMTAEQAALVDAIIGFCHTTCAHQQPRYGLEDVARAFHSHPDVALRLVRLFEVRFDPSVHDREARYPGELAAVERELDAYNTGRRMLDEFRRSVFRVALAFVRHGLKTNFFVAEKRALAFRLDPAYLDDLGPTFTQDLPRERPFRVTFFHTRDALAYHVGFADIARGGWRTVLTRSRDEYVTVANRIFREAYVLAHTQHLKNKDIYEGGSKLVAVVRVPGAASRVELDQRLHGSQLALFHAFLDLFVTEGGRARDPRVVDHYGEEEPLELGPDENMHDAVVEAIAALSVRRGYLLGAGVISSKKVGISHKEHGVTSIGIMAFAAAAMRDRGIDIERDSFTVKLTGGPNGDVAGNFLRLLLARCPRASVRLVVDGTAALHDPAGLDREGLGRLLMRADADAFDLSRLSPGGFALFRNVRRQEGLRELSRRVQMEPAGLRETWVTVDELNAELDELPFAVPADLFVPAGGRPETVDGSNWSRLVGPGGPTAKVIVEGANSYLTPEARLQLQRAGVVVLRDAAANKCGVISSSYEILGNLLLDDTEFLAHKERYVLDVLAVLEQRARDEAELILRRHREARGARTYTEISDALAVEINEHKSRLFAHFEAHPEVWDRPHHLAAALAHLPGLLRGHHTFRARLSRLPAKVRAALLAAEVATAIVYRGGFDQVYEERVEDYVARTYGAPTLPDPRRARRPGGAPLP